MTNLSQWEWIVACALFQKGKVDRNYLIKETKLAIPGIMRNCRKCGRKFYMFCPDCEFRNGSPIPDCIDEHAHRDLIHEFSRLQTIPIELAHALYWMKSHFTINP